MATGLKAHRGQQVDPLKGFTTSEGQVTNRGERWWQGDLFEGFTIPEGTSTNRGERWWQGDLFEGFTPLEGLFTNRGERLWQFDAHEGSMPQEGPIGYLCNAVSHDDVNDIHWYSTLAIVGIRCPANESKGVFECENYGRNR